MFNDFTVSSTALGVLNARSAVHKAALIHDVMNENKLNLLTVTETWIASDALEVMKLDIAPPGFSVIHQHRGSYDDKRGGGIAFIYPSDFKCIKVPSFTHFEHLITRTFISRRPIDFISIYRPPSGSILEFLIELKILIDNTFISNRLFIITGDFNCPRKSINYVNQ